jgi:hypothetical protein
MTRCCVLTGFLLLVISVGACYNDTDGNTGQDIGTQNNDYIMPVEIDSVPAEDVDTRYTSLTDQDFIRVANELQVEVAAIKAVVVIEAGHNMEGFWAPGLPVINHDRSLWSKCKSKVKSNEKAPASTTIPSGLPAGLARRAWQKLINARKINIQQANLSTFWGMFQIGGFNYALCGCESIEEFVRLMSYSELEQLELFAAFITNTNMVQYLRTKNWAAFARKYNGNSYAKRGYHTRMAAAYKKFSAKK